MYLSCRLRSCWPFNIDYRRKHIRDGSDLSDAHLTNTNLSFADLTGSDFSDAKLSNANLKSADFTGTDLSDVNLTDAIGDFVGAAHDLDDKDIIKN